MNALSSDIRASLACPIADCGLKGSRKHNLAEIVFVKFVEFVASKTATHSTN